VVLGIAACSGDVVTAPNSCPPYCAGVTIRSIDTLLVGAVSRDSTYRGYEDAPNARQLQLAGPGGFSESRAIMKFPRFSDRIQRIPGDTTTGEVIQTDSFRLELFVPERSPDDVQIAIYRIPLTIDSTSTFAQLSPWFEDSTRLAQLTVAPDTQGLVKVVFPASSLPTFADDSNQVAIGVAVAAPGTGSASLGSNEGTSGGFLARYAQVDSVAGVPVTRQDGRIPEFDTFVFQPLAAPAAGALVVGGVPAARSFIGLNVPRFIVDSSTVVRATLLVIPSEPVPAASGDTLRIMAHALAADVGPKSPVGVTPADTSSLAGAFVAAGVSDTIRIDVTEVLRFWRGTTLPHVLVLRAVPEGGALGELRFWSSADPTRQPVLDITYVPRVGYGAP
jgi:hypothetical protein